MRWRVIGGVADRNDRDDLVEIAVDHKGMADWSVIVVATVHLRRDLAALATWAMSAKRR